MSDLANQSAGALSGDVYRRAAQLQVIFSGLCDDTGCPLTEQQKVLLAEVAHLAFDGTEASLAEMLTAEDDLRNLGNKPPRIFGWQPHRFPHDPEVGR